MAAAMAVAAREEAVREEAARAAGRRWWRGRGRWLVATVLVEVARAAPAARVSVATAAAEKVVPVRLRAPVVIITTEMQYLHGNYWYLRVA